MSFMSRDGLLMPCINLWVGHGRAESKRRPRSGGPCRLQGAMAPTANAVSEQPTVLGLKRLQPTRGPRPTGSRTDTCKRVSFRTDLHHRSRSLLKVTGSCPGLKALSAKRSAAGRCKATALTLWKLSDVPDLKASPTASNGWLAEWSCRNVDQAMCQKTFVRTVVLPCRPRSPGP